MGNTGATQISADEIEELDRQWQSSPVAPLTAEDEPAVFGADGRYSYSRLCPEIGFDFFGYFASRFSGYGDEIDSDLAHTRLGREGANSEDPHWRWAEIDPMHYTDCPQFSLLQVSTREALTENSSEQDGSLTQATRTWWQIDWKYWLMAALAIIGIIVAII